ncbi:MAG: glycosyltransferase family 39 protein [Ktedonobacterales bacterium]|nr:glycosyltransferase family 39 protein [Ktedonobacterales bacterium]
MDAKIYPLTPNRATALTLLADRVAVRERSAALLAGLRRHGGPLALLACACAIGQQITVTQAPLAIQTADTPSYLHVATGIASRGLFFDQTRTPGYPALLASVFTVAGHANMGAVVAVQTALVTLAALQLYGLALRLGGQPWLAGCTGAFMGMSVYFTNWERVIGTEALATWAVITLFGLFARYLHTGARRWLVALAVWSVVVILIRPFFLYLPLLLLGMLALRAWQRGQFRAQMGQLALAGGIVAGLLLAYMGANAAVCGYFGLSDVGTVNMFGKVLEYQMQDQTDDPRFAVLQSDLQGYLHGANEPWGFPYHYPAYAVQHYRPLADYTQAIIARHPLEYAQKTVPDVLLTLTASPTLYAALAPTLPQWMTGVVQLASAPLAAYLLFPLLLGWVLWRWSRSRGSAVETLAATLGLALAGTILMAAAGAYTVLHGTQAVGDFYRLRAPLDWAFVLLLVYGWRRKRTPTADPTA